MIEDYWAKAGADPVTPRPPRRPRWILRLVLLVLAVLLATTGLGIATGIARSPTSALPDLALPTTNAGTAHDPANVEDVAASVDPAVVDINTTLGYQNARAAGTGIVLTQSGLVVTNNHVIAGATSITVTDVGNHRSYGANVVGYDRSKDIALVQMAGASGLATVTLGDSSTLQPGQSIVAIGDAGGVGGPPTAVSGTVTALNQTITATDEASGMSSQLTGLIQTAASLEPGDSGGPLVDSSAHVVGINTAASVGTRLQVSADARGFAIPIDQALGVARAIAAGHGSPTIHVGPSALLGVDSTVNHRSGAIVVGVLAGSPADLAGLAPGDVIESLGGQAVGSPATLSTVIDQHHPGDRVSLDWVDAGGHMHSASVQLASGPPG